ncbi:MAG: PorT family protein [Bacteroidales bacterium]|nr:PorT family protein [Bacteroidales bacterium]
MKRVLLIVMTLMLALPLTAQYDAESYYRNKTHRYVGLGLKGGVSMPSYFYGIGSDLNSLPADSLYRRIRPLFGLQCEIPLSSDAYIAPELMLIQRGDVRMFHNIPSDQDIRYLVKVNYLDLRVPVEVLLFSKKKFNPYLFAGVDFGLVLPNVEIMGKSLSGTFTEEGASIIQENVNASNMAPFDLGVFGGVGLRYAIEFDRWSLALKFQAAYSLGLFETYSQKEVNSEVPAANLGNGGTHYSIGHRFNRGLECTFGVVLPLHFKGGDACSSFDSVYRGRKRGRSSSF